MAQSVQVKKVNWWYESLADWMLANPDRTLTEAARYFNCTLSWISIVKNSDTFKEYWQIRREQVNHQVACTVTDRATAVAEVALERLQERLETTGDVLPVSTLLDISDKSMKWLGFGAKASSPTQVQVNVGVDPAALARARELLKQSHGLTVEEPTADTKCPEIPAPAGQQLLIEAEAEAEAGDLEREAP